jgi:hypothetical protein
MNYISRWLLATIGTPTVGLLAIAGASVSESLVRMALGRPALLDDAAIRAEEIMNPLLVVGFVVLSWIYVAPLAWALRRRRRSLAALTISLPIWLLTTAVLHAPAVDSSPLVTASVIAAFVGVPVFVSAVVAGFAVRPNPSIERDVQGLSPSAAPHVKR